MQVLTESFGPIDTNSYLLLHHESRQGIWIDPAPGSAQWVESSLPRDYEPLAILITHSHWDHIADIGHSPLFLNAITYVHPLDSENLTSPGSDGLSWPRGVTPSLPGTIQHLSEGTLELGGFSFKVLHTPGHSPGSCCFLLERENLFIGGDTLFYQGFGRVDNPGGSPKAMLQSLRRLSQLNQGLILLPGHGDSCDLSDLTWLHERFKESNG